MLTHPHIPERSGFPSAVRGAGAARSGVPSGFFGTFGVAYPSHCAASDGSNARASRSVGKRVLRDVSAILGCTVMVDSETDDVCRHDSPQVRVLGYSLA